MKELKNICGAVNSMYSSHILTDIGCRSMWEDGRKIGFCINLRIPYYRGLPLSCIDGIDLTIDGNKIDPEDMYIESEGRIFPYTDILTDNFNTDYYWRFGKLLRVIVNQAGGIDQGVHHVKVVVGLRRSYTPTMVSSSEKDLTFA